MKEIFEERGFRVRETYTKPVEFKSGREERNQRRKHKAKGKKFGYTK